MLVADVVIFFWYQVWNELKERGGWINLVKIDFIAEG